MDLLLKKSLLSQRFLSKSLIQRYLEPRGSEPLTFMVQFLGGLGGQVPAILVNHGVAVARRRLEKALIGLTETACEILR